MSEAIEEENYTRMRGLGSLRSGIHGLQRIESGLRGCQQKLEIWKFRNFSGILCGLMTRPQARGPALFLLPKVKPNLLPNYRS